MSNISYAGKIHVYRARNLLLKQRWYWRAIAKNGRVVATSGEGYGKRLEAVMYAKKYGPVNFEVVDEK